MTTIARFDMTKACYMLFMYHSHSNSDDFDLVDYNGRSGGLYSLSSRSH